jgi:hypothetical protein
MRLRTVIILVAAMAIMTLPAQAVMVEVEVTGVVEFNQVNFGEFADANSGDPANVSFIVDSDNFVDSSNFPTRGYVVDHASFQLTLGTASAGLASPYPAGRTPYFVLRDNDPAVDGFFFADNNVDFPFPGLPLDEPGQFGPFTSNYQVTYLGDTLMSLDILEALGTYTFDGLTVFNYAVGDGPLDAIGLIFEQMTIRAVPEVVALDIKPGSCPNPINTRSRGVLPVAILGTPELDVATIDPASIRLAGVAPLRSSLEDVGTPFMPFTGREDCVFDCNEEGPDGWTDLTLRFDSQEVIAALGGVEDGQCLVLELVGFLAEEFGGTAIRGEDVVRINSHARGGPGGSRLSGEEARFKRADMPGAESPRARVRRR